MRVACIVTRTANVEFDLPIGGAGESDVNRAGLAVIERQIDGRLGDLEFGITGPKLRRLLPKKDTVEGQGLFQALDAEPHVDAAARLK